jgi:asparagine synthase (glutamine-hydrolysing)
VCGIAGVYGENNPELVGSMLPKLAHRGPDDSGIFCGPNITLGHTRLSIIDVERGHQPLFNEDKNIALVCNGEIYNHQALRKRLTHHAFQTRSDSEVILHLYEDMGTDCFKLLDGMFAFVLFDGESLFAARDPLGIKPLYYAQSPGRWFFSSEIKALAGVVDDIHEFPNGSAYNSRNGFEQYYEVPSGPPDISETETAVKGLRPLFEQAVVKRLMADVPLGVLLSGGLDSSLVSAIASKHHGGINSFSVGVEGSSDVRAARLMADFLDVNHHEFLYTLDDVLDILPGVIYSLESYDAPLVRSALPTFFVSRLARQHVKVILSGEGSDELFSGYHYYKNYQDDELLHDELVRSVKALHNINLQRLDRLSMAHSLEARVPFLDIPLVEYALRISPLLKIDRRQQIEKWILRKAFEDLLPEEIIWRVKTQFAEGCGSANMLEAHAERDISDSEFHAALDSGVRCRSKEEFMYYKIFMEHFSDRAVVDAVGHWEEKV